MRLSNLNISEDIEDVFEGIGDGLKSLSESLSDGFFGLDEPMKDLLKLQELEKLEGAFGLFIDLSATDLSNITTSFTSFAESIIVLSNSIKELDTQKLKDLNNLPSDIGPQDFNRESRSSSPSSLPVLDPFGATVIEGAIEPKLMISETPSVGEFFTVPNETQSLADAFATPVAETQIQQATDTGTTSLAEVFAEPVVIEKQIKETGMGGIGSYEVFSENLAKEMGDLSSEQYIEKLNSYVENNNQLIKMGIEGRTELDINKFAPKINI